MVAACDLDKKHLQSGGGHHQPEVRQQGLQGVSRLSRNAGARRHRRGDDRHSRSVARHRGHRSGQPQEGHLRREAAGPHHRRAAGHRESGREEQRHLADRFVAALGAQFSQGRGDRPQRPHRHGDARRSGPARRPSRLSRHGAGAAEETRCRIHPGQNHQPGADRAGHAGLGSCRDRAAAGFRLRPLDRPVEDGALHRAARLPELALELQHRRRPVDSTGSATTATSPTGDWASIPAARRKWKATASFRQPNAVWNTATKYTVNCIYRKEVTQLRRWT